MTDAFSVKGMFVCKNDKCKFRKSFPYFHDREARKCPSCKESMIKEAKNARDNNKR